MTVDDGKLDGVNRIGPGQGRYCGLPVRADINDYLVPAVYFHITTAYSIPRKLGAPPGKANDMAYLAPPIHREARPFSRPAYPARRGRRWIGGPRGRHPPWPVLMTPASFKTPSLHLNPAFCSFFVQLV